MKGKRKSFIVSSPPEKDPLPLIVGTIINC